MKFTRIKETIDARGKNQKWLAEKLGISENLGFGLPAVLSDLCLKGLKGISYSALKVVIKAEWITLKATVKIITKN